MSMPRQAPTEPWEVIKKSFSREARMESRISLDLVNRRQLSM